MRIKKRLTDPTKKRANVLKLPVRGSTIFHIYSFPVGIRICLRICPKDLETEKMTHEKESQTK